MYDDRVCKWISRKALAAMVAGEVPGMTALDIAAVREGQAAAILRGYQARPRPELEREALRWCKGAA